ncbi:hypothetical protein [Knoellia sp. Soil729]|uniref:hypothetical protein n=1 Tax=Knoellia sp. Soil729 TaxID=1736394 RepID=UPI0006F24DB6|nr:hypothetical protein [Knoellia sp. Soil729]KRE42131.1 hypothetical protein ASG74_06620 [Knoellia sp. Soil729]
MEWVALSLLAAAVVTVTALVATGRLEVAGLAEPTTTRAPLELPQTVRSSDVDVLSMGSTLYGYAPAEVDKALDSRRDRLADQERQLAGRDGHVHPDA